MAQRYIISTLPVFLFLKLLFDYSVLYNHSSIENLTEHLAVARQCAAVYRLNTP